jgi:hypothetical protein
LYDLENDPDEVVNLAYDPKCSGVLKEMKQKLRQECMKLPGTFAEFKTINDCSDELKKLIDEAKKRPLVPVRKKRRITNKMPKRINKYIKGD